MLAVESNSKVPSAIDACAIVIQKDVARVRWIRIDCFKSVSRIAVRAADKAGRDNRVKLALECRAGAGCVVVVGSWRIVGVGKRKTTNERGGKGEE